MSFDLVAAVVARRLDEMDCDSATGSLTTSSTHDSLSDRLSSRPSTELTMSTSADESTLLPQNRQRRPPEWHILRAGAVHTAARGLGSGGAWNSWQGCFSIPPNFVTRHNPVLTVELRAVVVQWLFSVQHTLRLRPETLFLAVSVCDRGLAVAAAGAVSVAAYWTLAAAALHVAAKMEETEAPSVRRIVELAPHGCV